MAINRDSNGYTFGFAIVLVVVVGSILALLAMGLKPMQDRNAEVKKKLDILSAMMDIDALGIDRSNGEAEFDKYVNLDNAVVLDANGNIKEGVVAFDVDIKKEYKDKTLDVKDRNYPLYLSEMDGKAKYILPVVGKGLWGPIWGNICIGEDLTTIEGASFGHKGETPGLGAEIKQQFFIDRWIGEKITDESGSFAKFEIVKDGSGASKESKVDGITGGTITSKGVEEMANRCLEVYVPYFNKLKKN
ncbi:MAG: NADH:ubiquinone reductase (Na(+)-transporting) subunit C [Crocinitomicaceae bacterium]|nr:NADH:ubiquinone reductase (Na(+)-transporting) subunit C [Crocinitomicaceae bacterium]